MCKVDFHHRDKQERERGQFERVNSHVVLLIRFPLKQAKSLTTKEYSYGRRQSPSLPCT